MATIRNLTIEVKDDIKFYLSESENYETNNILSGTLGKAIPNISEFHLERRNKCVIIVWKDYGTLSVEAFELAGGTRYDLGWVLANMNNKKQLLNDAIDMTGAHWYGAAQVRNQAWPIEKWCRPVSAYVCGDSFADQYGGVQERYWLSSKGAAIFADEDVPLFVGISENNDKLLNFISKFEKPYKNVSDRHLYLKYSIYHSTDVKTVHQLVAKEKIANPIAIPDEAMFRFPVWSTWAKYKKKINQNTVLHYAKEIDDHRFKSCQIEIDDDWTPSYGDMVFHKKKFPDPKLMMHTLKSMGHRVTLWVHPFASPFSRSNWNNNQWWVNSGKLPGICKWWNGVGRHVDFTNPDASNWFKENLKKLQDEYGVASFKFDAGEINWLPPYFRFFKDFQNPNIFTKRYVEMACEVDSEIRCHEVRVGWRTQHLPVFVRMMDKDSNWTFDNGLKTLIPHALTFSLIGYHFMLPDMIGGNAYKTEYPDRELFIRWLQANVFLPSMQFSIVPWQYDGAVIDISRKMCELHEQYSDYIIQLAKECISTGKPIIRPLWWINPGDDVTLHIDSEFLLGSKVLVAPVLDKGARVRDIYFPLGKWKDENTGDIIEGPKWVRKYKADLHVLPYFTNVTRDSPIKLAKISPRGNKQTNVEDTTAEPLQEDNQEQTAVNNNNIKSSPNETLNGTKEVKEIKGEGETKETSEQNESRSQDKIESTATGDEKELNKELVNDNKDVNQKDEKPKNED